MGEPADPDVVTLREAARRLGVTRQALARSLRAGTVPGVKIGREWRLHWPTVLAALVPGGAGST